MELVKSIDLKSLSKLSTVSIYVFSLGCFLVVFGLGAFILDAPTSLWVTLGSLLPCLVLVTVIHEGLHGIGFKAFTGKAKFGACRSGSLGFVFYATSPGSKLRRGEMILTALIPQALTVLCLCLFLYFRVANGSIAYVLTVIAAINLGGGAGDMWLVYQILRWPSGCIYEDTVTGTNIWKPTS